MNTSESSGRKNSSRAPRALTYESGSPRATRALGALLAQELRKEKGPIVLALRGDLGSGKTTFLKGLARGFRINALVISPTFLIVRRYKIPGRKSLRYFYHVDAYRLARAKEFRDIGWNAMLHAPAHIVAIEWAEHVPKRLLPPSIEIAFSHASPKKRIITIRADYL